MSKWRVEIEHTFTKYGEYEIEADNEENACTKALQEWDFDQDMVYYEPEIPFAYAEKIGG